MDVAYISAISALVGSAVGGFTSTVTTWLTQRAQARAGQLSHELTRREDLYRDFITAASQTYGEALVSNEPRLPDLVALFDDQPDASAVTGVHRRVCRESHAEDHRDVFRSEPLSPRVTRPGEGQGQHRSAEGVQRSSARRGLRFQRHVGKLLCNRDGTSARLRTRKAHVFRETICIRKAIRAPTASRTICDAGREVTDNRSQRLPNRGVHRRI
jgi:hypothetical protein